MKKLESDVFQERMRAAISFSWSVFLKKAGNHLVMINKEASMQLHYAYVLQQVIPLITFSDSEKYSVELEKGISLKGRRKEIDVLFIGEENGAEHRIAVEMKCYKTRASSGGLRGASDIFMKDVYEDLALLEDYISSGISHEGVELVMTDMERLAHPLKKDAKCWDYDISDGVLTGPCELNTPIGGKNISIKLEKQYCFHWEKYGDFWFLELEGGIPG